MSEEIGGVAYVFNFYNDLENLTNHFAAYVNIRTKLKAKYPDLRNEEKKVKLSEEDRQTLHEVADNFRSWATRCYVKTQSLSKKIKKLDAEKIKKQYDRVIESPVTDLKTANDYVVELNKAFVEGGLQDLLVRNKDLVEDLLD